MRITTYSTFILLSITSTLICSSLAICVTNDSSTRPKISHPPASPPPPSILTSNSSSPVSQKVSVPTGGSYTELCNKADYPDACVATIKSVSPITTLSTTFDPESALKTLIKGATIATQQALTAGQALSKLPGHDNVTQSVIDSCVSGFEDALHDLQASETALNGNDKATCMINLSAVIDDYESCSDAFTDNAQPVHPMQAYEDLLHKHASNCLAIGSLIH